MTMNRAPLRPNVYFLCPVTIDDQPYTGDGLISAEIDSYTSEHQGRVSRGSLAFLKIMPNHSQYQGRPITLELVTDSGVYYNRLFIFDQDQAPIRTELNFRSE